ncbi:hypothetical protein [Hominilimicola sp.]|jgi:hypothetical protein|uniref:hypothetical protein n=1 Tax=Hominilimicola sp. TaxID=3073571 RepID=UPI00307EE4E7
MKKILFFIPILTLMFNTVFAMPTKTNDEIIADYPFRNRVNELSVSEKQEITKILTACADVMRFNIRNYDYDKLFKYVLYTHKNFQILTDIPADTGNSSNLGYNNVKLVNSDYIDYIMTRVFRITPEKPPVNELLERGFCYNDGYYYYIGGFGIYFATEIVDIKGVYDIGGGVTFVIFSDIYYEGNTRTPEYSFAILQNTENGYSLMRLGMGEDLPTSDEVRLYSPFKTYNEMNWNINNVDNNNDVDFVKSYISIPILLLVISLGLIGLTACIAALVKRK